jgi:hypothetical protein
VQQLLRPPRRHQGGEVAERRGVRRAADGKPLERAALPLDLAVGRGGSTHGRTGLLTSLLEREDRTVVRLGRPHRLHLYLLEALLGEGELTLDLPDLVGPCGGNLSRLADIGP